MTVPVWLIPLLPLAAFAVIGLLCLRPPREKAAPYLLILALAASLGLSLFALRQIPPGSGHEGLVYRWMVVGDLQFELGVLIDPLSGLMLAVVCLVSLLIQIYSIGYMKGEVGYGRYFAYMSLFTCSMLGLVAANNLLLTYFFWELVGLCSYLLIGFWYRRPAAASAAKKAFVVTRFGDVGLLIGILLVAQRAGTFNYLQLQWEVLPAGVLGAGVTTAAALLIFSGAVGKSAQFPLHVWLPDAMEGPTPVSALIHAATMVAAGVFLVARTYFLFAAAPAALLVVAIIGALTALMAAAIAIGQDDIKRILAYSTISQLGYMMLALGVGGYVAGLFHLTTHAFFKALLFLCAGSVIHAVHTNNIAQMGGLHSRMRLTSITCLAGALALAGIFPFAGFWSKDEILAAVFHSTLPGHYVLYGVALAVVFLTAFYMFRLWFLTFAGSPRTDVAKHAHESPAVMTGPLLILGLLAVVGGALLLRFPPAAVGLSTFLAPNAAAEGGSSAVKYGLIAASLLVALAGIGVAWRGHRRQALHAESLARSLPGLYESFRRRLYIDDAYEFFVLRILLVGSRLAAWFDRHVVNGMVDGVAWLTGRMGVGLRRVQTGQAQFYVIVILFAVLAALIVMAAAGYPFGLRMVARP